MTQNYKIRGAEIRTFGADNTEYAVVKAGTTWGKVIVTTFFEDFQVAMVKEALNKNTLHLLEPIPGNIDVINVPTHFRKNREGVIIKDDNENPVVYTKVAVFYMTEKGEDAETRGNRMFRDFIKAGTWELAEKGAPDDNNEPI